MSKDSQLLYDHVAKFSPLYALGENVEVSDGVYQNALLEALRSYEEVLDDDSEESMSEKQFMNTAPSVLCAFQSHGGRRAELRTRLWATSDAMVRVHKMLRGPGAGQGDRKGSNISELARKLLAQNLMMRWQDAHEDRRAIELSEMCHRFRHDKSVHFGDVPPVEELVSGARGWARAAANPRRGSPGRGSARVDGTKPRARESDAQGSSGSDARGSPAADEAAWAAEKARRLRLLEETEGMIRAWVDLCDGSLEAMETETRSKGEIGWSYGGSLQCSVVAATIAPSLLREKRAQVKLAAQFLDAVQAMRESPRAVESIRDACGQRAVGRPRFGQVPPLQFLGPDEAAERLQALWREARRYPLLLSMDPLGAGNALETLTAEAKFLRDRFPPTLYASRLATLLVEYLQLIDTRDHSLSLFRGARIWAFTPETRERSAGRSNPRKSGTRGGARGPGGGIRSALAQTSRSESFVRSDEVAQASVLGIIRVDHAKRELVPPLIDVLYDGDGKRRQIPSTWAVCIIDGDVYDRVKGLKLELGGL
jgi:hypothetical protein